MFLMIPSTKIAQMVLLPWTKEPLELQIRNIFKKTSPESHVQNQNIFTEMFLLMPSTKTAQMVSLR